MSEAEDPPLVEIGLVVVGRLEPHDLRAVERAREIVLATLGGALPAFAFRVPIAYQREAVTDGVIEPVHLLDLGVAERDVRHWDFAMVVTHLDLRAYSQPFTFGTPSRATNTAALSTARIDPGAVSPEPGIEERVRVLAARLAVLALHVFGHLVDVPHSDDPADFMMPPRTPEDLDRMQRFSGDAVAVMRAALTEVADQRLEEQTVERGARFFATALWRERRNVVRAIADIAPWQFPRRLPRFTTAAASAMIVLLMTAEAWELGMSQPPLVVVVLAAATILVTARHLLARHHLTVTRTSVAWTEQRVLSHASIILAVFLGMTTMYVALFAVTSALAWTLYPRAVVESWAPSLGGRIGLPQYVALAGVISSLGLAIGALGASFEGKEYFRHVAYVDEET